MATHVDKMSDIFVPAMSRAEFTAQLQNGDLLFCSGKGAISEAIERETKSPWSHVGIVWIPGNGIEPLLIEAVFKFGVRCTRMAANYIGAYNGDVVLCRRALTSDEHREIIAKALTRLGDDYDWQSEVQQAAHKFFGFLPEHATLHKLYCSGLVQFASTAASPALQRPSAEVDPSPEDNWCDPTVLPQAMLLEGAK